MKIQGPEPTNVLVILAGQERIAIRLQVAQRPTARAALREPNAFLDIVLMTFVVKMPVAMIKVAPATAVAPRGNAYKIWAPSARTRTIASHPIAMAWVSMAPPLAFAAHKQHALKDRIVITAAGFVAIPSGKVVPAMASARLATVSIQPAVSTQHVTLAAAVRRGLALKMMGRPAAMTAVCVSRPLVLGPIIPVIVLVTPSFVVKEHVPQGFAMPMAHAFAPMAPVLIIRPAKSIPAIVHVYPIVPAKFVVKMVVAPRPVVPAQIPQPATRTVV